MAIFVHVCTFAWQGALRVLIAPGIEEVVTTLPWVARRVVIFAATDEMKRSACEEQRRRDDASH
jgi:hypothetical protein